MLFAAIMLSGCLLGADAPLPAPLYFDTNDVTADHSDVPTIAPWKAVKLDPEYAGVWSVAGDVDGDSEVEIVAAKNFDENDVHYTSSAAAHKLDGTVLWTWGDPDKGRKNLHHDVALQIHDWDNDGRNDVVLLTEGAIVVLEGATGKEQRRIAIPKEATDSLAFCDLAGNGHASDILVKDRYTNLYAYNLQGEQRWHVKYPGGYRTAHQARPMDIDGDGRDEIMAGYALLNPDGTVRWTFDSEKVEQKRGHLDCARIMTPAEAPADMRIALTCCGAKNLAVADGTGKTLWEVPGHHFESINVGHIIPGHPGPQLLVDIDHVPRGESPLCVFDADGVLLGRMIGDYCRQHRLIDWDGDGADEFAVAHSHALYGHTGTRIATFDLPGHATIVAVGDMDGDNVPDLLFGKEDAVYLFRNTSGKQGEQPLPLGMGVNFTLY